MFVRESIVRKPDRDLNKGDDVVVCLPCLERVENIIGS